MFVTSFLGSSPTRPRRHAGPWERGPGNEVDMSVEDVCCAEDTEDVLKMYVVLNLRNLKLKCMAWKLIAAYFKGFS